MTNLMNTLWEYPVYLLFIGGTMFIAASVVFFLKRD